MYVPNLIRTQEMERFGFFFHFWCRLDLHNRSRHYPVWFFVTNRTRPIDHVNLVSFLALIALVRSITLMSYFFPSQLAPNLISHDNST